MAEGEGAIDVALDEGQSESAEGAKRHVEVNFVDQQTALRVRLESVSVNPTTKWGLLGGVGEAKGRVNLGDSRVPFQTEWP